MSKELDLDDVAATSRLAEEELAHLRNRVSAFQAQQRAYLEQLGAERKRILEAESKLADARREAAEAQATIQHIAEYWNRDANHMATSDALWHIIGECESADKSALQSAIEQAVAPYREDAERYRWLCESATEQQWIEYGGYTAKQHIDPAIDAARNAP